MKRKIKKKESFNPKSTAKTLFLGENKLIMGDCLTTLPQFPDGSFDACITDPPYNIAGYDHKKEIGWYKSNPTWREGKKFNKMASDWDKFTNRSYFEFCREWIGEVMRVVKPNGNIFIFGSYHNIFKMGYLLESLGSKLINSIVWYKRNAFPNITQRMYCESTEYILWAANNPPGEAKNWTFNYQVAKEINGGKQMRNMWDIPMTPTREKKHGKHPSQKPLEVVGRLILCCTKENDLILDPFCGSGTVPAAAKLLGRRFVGIDSNENYIELAKKRVASVQENNFEALFEAKPHNLKKTLKPPGREELLAV